MNNREPKGVIASLQALGLIDKENKVTVQGIDTLTRYVAHANNGEIQTEEEDFIPEYLKTWDASKEDIEQWEEEHFGAVISTQGEGWMEVCLNKWYNADTGEPSGPDTLCIAIKSDYGNEEALVDISQTAEIIKLRNFLNKFIERNL